MPQIPLLRKLPVRNVLLLDRMSAVPSTLRTAPVLCMERERLRIAFVAAVSELNRIQTEQVAALSNGELFPFEEGIATALQRRENAKYALIAHQEQHGC